MFKLLLISILALFNSAGLAVALYGLPKQFQEESDRYYNSAECTGPRASWSNCKSIISLDGDVYYSGNFLNGKQHGYGVQVNENKNTHTTGLWYKGDLIWAVVQTENEKISTAFSTDHKMIGFTEIRKLRPKQNYKMNDKFTYAHILGEETVGNIVIEQYETGNLDSAYFGPADGLKPHGLGFFHVRGIGWQWCTVGSGNVPCSKQPITALAIPTLKESFAGLNDTEKVEVQRRLRKLWYYTDDIDGKWGQNTQYALLKYLALHTSLPVTPEAEFTTSMLRKLFITGDIVDLRLGDMSRLDGLGYEDKIETFGTGFVFSKNGHILTNEHVVSECSKVQFHLNGNPIDVEVVAANTQVDLAILSSDLRPSSLLNIKQEMMKTELMDKVFAIGFPFGAQARQKITVTSGIISSEAYGITGSKMFQFDAAIQPGNSGGPVIDEDKNLIGIATAKADTEYYLENFGSIPENMSFALDLESIVLFLAGNNFTSNDFFLSDNSPKIKDIVGMLACESDKKIRLEDIHKARLQR